MSPVSRGLHRSWESSRDRPKINLMERLSCTPTSLEPISWDSNTHSGSAVPRPQGWSFLAGGAGSEGSQTAAQ